MPLTLTPEHTNAIYAHAARDYPHECCGFLIGRSSPPSLTGKGAGGLGPHVAVVSTTPAVNTRGDSPRNRFEIEPAELMRVDKAARAHGLSVVGFYHSHPDAPARPSEYDREHAWPGYCYVIVSVVAGQPQEMRNWLLRDDRSGFDADPMTETDTSVTEENT